MSDGVLSIVIPTLDAASLLPGCLSALGEARHAGLLREIVIADAGGCAETVEIAHGFGASVFAALPGRGPQLIAGAARSSGDWLLFLHADTRLENGWSREVKAFIAGESAAEMAAAFRLRLDDAAPEARRIERLANWRSRRLALPYGDQGLLISRRLYDRVGGYRPLPLMEDVDLVRRLVRLGGHRLRLLQSAAVTSAARYRRDGWWFRPARNLMLLTLWYLGLPPAWIARLYG
ncbi:MAG: TIGR04283 family arsenosugar biosynthesis glycosyltransferase [Kiloniellaceae bacterium]